MIDGIVDANQVVVSPKVQGILEQLSVDEGSSVRAGQLIARLDTAELSADVEADRAPVANLRAQLAQSESNYQVALNETAGDLAGAQARLAAAKAQLVLSEAQFQRNQSDFQRTKTLAAQGVSAQQELDHMTKAESGPQIHSGGPRGAPCTRSPSVSRAQCKDIRPDLLCERTASQGGPQGGEGPRRGCYSSRILASGLLQ